MKLLLFINILFFMFSQTIAKDHIKSKLSQIKKETVSIHNDILKNNEELKKIKIDIDRNRQKKIIYEKYIKDRENISRRLVFLLQDKIYISPITKLTRNLTVKSDDLITKQIIREFFLKKVKEGINQYLLSLNGIEELKKNLDKKFLNYEVKQKRLNKKLVKLEKKIKEVSQLQKKIKVDLTLKNKEKKFKKKARNLNELVIGIKKNKKIVGKLKKNKIQYPVRGKIISNYGEGKDTRKSKDGLVFEVSRESFVTSPINGMVVYANQFRSYGNLIIIENDEGFSCVLSGMRNILVSSGSEVLMGEPIAKITSEVNNQLYFELRLNGKIINPKSKVEIL